MHTGSRPTINKLLSLSAIAVTMAIASSTASFAQTTPAAILPSEPAPDLTPQVAAAPTPDLRQVECIAKIIMHEAANEPRIGRVAVAQVIRTRIKSGRFAADACAVAKQHGQFFDVDAFEPQRSTDGWSDAVAIATDTLNGGGDEVAPGALFFHAAYSPMAGRVRVAQIGGHVFYR